MENHRISIVVVSVLDKSRYNYNLYIYFINQLEKNIIFNVKFPFGNIQEYLVITILVSS